MKKDFNRLLKELDIDEMREELRMLYDRFPVVREYYKMELSGSTKVILDKYKADLRRAFFSSQRRVSRRGRSEAKRYLKPSPRSASTPVTWWSYTSTGRR